jgi:phosphatidate cytidylyltransferase
MLRWRLLLGTIFIAALVGLFWGDAQLAASGHSPGLLLIPLAIVVALGATQEFLGMVRRREPLVNEPLSYLFNAAIVAAPWYAAANHYDPGDAQLAAYAAGVTAFILLEICRYDKDASKRVIERLAVAVLGLTYVGLLMSFVVRLRLQPEGIFPLVLTLVVVKMADTGAYTVGRLIGRHKLAPKLSPGKTIEGFFGGLVFSVLGAILVAYLFGADIATPIVGPEHRPFRFVGFALVVGAVGVAGDLIESLLKRDFGRKDSSDWMPGFGGVLDLVDSPLLAAPFAWFFWEFGLNPS